MIALPFIRPLNVSVIKSKSPLPAFDHTRKMTSADVEQKIWSVVRKTIVSYRYESADALIAAAERAIVRGNKPGYVRVVFLISALVEAFHRYLGRRPELPDEERVFGFQQPAPETDA